MIVYKPLSAKSKNPGLGCRQARKSVVQTFTPFDAQGGRGKMWQLFGEDMNMIIFEMNKSLTA